MGPDAVAFHCVGCHDALARRLRPVRALEGETMAQLGQVAAMIASALKECHVAPHRRGAQRHVHRPGVLRYVLPGVLATAANWPALAANMPHPVAGYWAQHDVIERLENLPKRYSCNELYYKYRDVLALLGARSGATILPFGCSGTPGTSLKVPTRVELRYQIAAPLPAAASAQVSLKVAQRTVTLQPGSPRSLQTDDCALVQKMGELLIPASGARIESAQLRCSTAPHAPGNFRVVIRAWGPIESVQQSSAP